ncbi:DUF4190 domain-containing protein [Aeromicrobium sp. IC_218]|uniref:DUF4190 domain-containing protein n=1 Tax=Aeromicrobium sp. IC_218 TaxID=2545468 RepID=UPI00103A9DDE|nr:DUF4190 domain-containing protein [Aeromicrobium sp. IC_218]TCI99792.1 DUF4190 domain-containing protein [Aeromicrobium sp. IC_218]
MTTNEPPFSNDPNQPGGLPPYGSGGDVPPPPPGGYGYGDGGYGAPPEQNKKALWSMILGIVGLLCCGIAGIVAIVLSNTAKKEIAASGGRQTGAGMATAGLVLGIVAIVLWIAGIVINLAVVGN